MILSDYQRDLLKEFMQFKLCYASFHYVVFLHNLNIFSFSKMSTAYSNFPSISLKQVYCS